ncbi:hypothetical protein RB195_019188 [Necator americanus]|uniref:Uncharacterized protein n=1 Tax=Necator americanus TaxID=51031 RepID=A0ABR1CCZ8_NECAM
MIKQNTRLSFAGQNTTHSAPRTTASYINLVLLHDDTVRPTLTGENVPLLSDKSPVQVTPSLLGLPDGKGKSIILQYAITLAMRGCFREQEIFRYYWRNLQIP